MGRKRRKRVGEREWGRDRDREKEVPGQCSEMCTGERAFRLFFGRSNGGRQLCDIA